MQIEKILEEREKEFDKKFVGEYDIIVDGINEPYITGILDKTLYSVDGLMDKAFDWHKQSLKQFIDGLVEWEENRVINRSDWNESSRAMVSHLKEIRKQLE